MNDNDLIEELRTTIEQFTDGVCAPAGLPARARRLARRQAVARTAGAGGSVVAIAGVATVFAANPGGTTTSLGAPPKPGHQLSGAPRARDTAYVIKHVRAQIAASATSTDVVENVLADGEADWMYVDPSTGVQYQRDVDPNGVPGSVTGIVATPVNGYLHFAILTVNEHDQTYAESDSVASAPMPTGTTTANSFSDPQGIQQALADGDVTQAGTTTIDGETALKLSLAHCCSDTLSVSSGGHTRTVTIPSSVQETATLYVDAQNYTLLRAVTTTTTSAGDSESTTQNWFPATPATIALTQLAIPSGYTQVTSLGQ